VIQPSVASKWNAHIRGLIETFRLADVPYELVVESAVHEASREFHNEIVTLVLGELSEFESFPLRWIELAWRLGLNLHAGQYGIDALKHPLSVKIFQSAIRIVRFFAAEQLKILRRSRIEIRLDVEQKDVNRIQALITENRAPVSLRDMQRRHGFTEGRILALAKMFPHLIVLGEIKLEWGRPSPVVDLARGQNLRNLRNQEINADNADNAGFGSNGSADPN
jgi:hypothetical protein